MNTSFTILENAEYLFNVTTDPLSVGVDRFVLQVAKETAPIVIQIAEGVLSVPYTENIQWYFNDVPIPDATQPTFLAEASGMYSVEVIYDGCKLKGSIEFIMTTLEETVADGLIVYPNPAREKIFVHAQKGGIESIDLINALGQVVDRVEFSPNNEIQTEIFLIADKPIGIYFLKITIEQNVFMQRIIKN